jgi:hypothetical protein
MPLFIPVPLHIVFPPDVIALVTVIFLLGHPEFPGFVRMARPHVAVQIFHLGSAAVAEATLAGLGVVMYVLAVGHGRGQKRRVDGEGWV